MCTSPSALMVVTMVSRIIGMAWSAPSSNTGSFAVALPLGDQGVPRLSELGLVVGGGVGGNAPIERLVLSVALGEPPGDLGARELDAEIEGVRAVRLDVELGVELEHVVGDVMAVAVIDVDAVLGDLDAEILVADLAGILGDLLRGVRERVAGVEREQPRGIVLGQAHGRRARHT